MSESKNHSQNILTLTFSGFAGNRNFSRLAGMPAQKLRLPAFILFGMSIVVVFLGFLLWFRFYDENTFLLTLPTIPLFLSTTIFGVSALLSKSMSGSLSFSRLFYVSSVGTFALSLTLVLGIFALNTFWGSIGGVTILLALFMSGIAWVAILLHHGWTELLGIRSGLATIVAGFLAACTFFASLYLWISMFAADLFFWDPMLFVEI